MTDKRARFYIPAILSSILLIVFALCVFPTPGTDSLVFLPPALSYAHHQGFANPLYYVDKFTDPTHTHRFNYYVPLFPWLMGIVGRIYADVRTIFLFCALLGSAGLFLYTREAIKAMAVPGRYWTVGVVLSLFYLPIFFLPTVSRPENLTFFVVFIIYLLYRNRSKVSLVAYVGILSLFFASLLATQILSFFFCFVFYALCDVLDTGQPVRSAIQSFIIFSLSLGIACLILAAGPIGFRETVDAVWWHATMVVGRTDNSPSLLFYYWALAPLSFGFLGVFLLASYLFIRELVARMRKAARLSVLSVLFLSGVLLWGLVKYVLYGAPTVYNITQFILPIMAYTVTAIAKIGKTAKPAIVFCALCAIGTLAMGRHLLMFTNMVASGKTFAAARELVMEQTGKNKKSDSL